jgi:hypothetical protein
MERVKRFELSTLTLARSRSTTELHPLYQLFFVFYYRSKSFEENGAGEEIRTLDIDLGKVALYH